MNAILNFIRNEPAMIVTIILGGLNLFFNLNDGQVDAVRNIVESIVILLGGTAVRQSVTPTSKLGK
jgi:Ni,Fe-hydrogenase I cytochrome b subunit